jgi:release factor glutamine methyltransferase
MLTIKTALAAAISLLQSVSDSPLLDAEVLLCKVLGKDRSYLRAWPDVELNPQHHHAYQVLVNDRQQGKPVAYITGIREFWSREFKVSPAVLIPRPDTELLIELSLELIPANRSCKIIDLGTGSGIIAVTLAAERPLAQISATDISEAALEIAKLNAAQHNTGTINFYHSDWFNNVPDGKFDLIISNPPYLSEDDKHLQQGDLRFEPTTALIANENGLMDIRIIAEAAIEKLELGGYIMVEHGFDQGLVIRKLFVGLGYQNVRTYEDLGGLPRVTVGQNI